jgi:hypothetical protein
VAMKSIVLLTCGPLSVTDTLDVRENDDAKALRVDGEV